MARYIYTCPAQSGCRGVLRPILQLPIYYETPGRTTLARLPPGLQNLLSSYSDQCCVEVVNVRDPLDYGDDGRDYGFVRVILRQLAGDGHGVRQNQFLHRYPLN